ncbi:hypothetical protein Patl1_33544 [Pistacia atlantica]|uniref:Uncharacterized protein n=1 Tax=Pistacia atlantica TaxID=434234 RepID=A0ACC0ZTX8_9ROSI|nr:hypothetical protein Patl1_33544 [Pistacia atlantica]
MAFFGKFGSILRQTTSRQIAGEISASKPSIYRAIRCMSSSQLFVGGLPYSCDDQSVREAFSKYSHVTEDEYLADLEGLCITRLVDPEDFVTYRSKKEASSAIQALDGQDLHGRRVCVKACRPLGGNFIALGGYEGTTASFCGSAATAYGGFDGCRWVTYENGVVRFIDESE